MERLRKVLKTIGKRLSKPGIRNGLANKVKPGAANIPTQVRNVAKTKRRHSSNGATFESKEMAYRVINPVLRATSRMIARTAYKEVPGSLNRLQMWLMRMERGNKHDARTPLLRAYSYKTIAENIIMGIVKRSIPAISQRYSGVPSFARVFTAVEDHQSKKIGPRGVFPPAHIWINKKIDEVWCDKPPKPELDRAALARALEWVSNLVPAHSLDVDESSIEEGFKSAGTEDEDPDSLNVKTNFGPWTWVKDWYHRVWDKSVTVAQKMTQVIALRQARFLWRKLLNAGTHEGITLHFMATANQRTNVATGYEATKDNTYEGVIISKLRLVCAMEKMDTILGKPILNRLIPACISIKNPDGTRPFTALTTPERIDKNMQIALKTAHDNGLTVLSTDFSGYDATVPPWLALEVAKAVSKWMTPRMASVFITLIKAEFYHTSIISVNKIYGEGPSSMKSGSIFTNIMDSLINLTGQRYGLEAGHFKSILNQFVQGDDALLTGEGVTPESFEKSSAELGFEANADKQFYETDHLSFCQKIHVLGYPGGIYPIARATAACLSLEDDVGIETDEAGQFPYVLAFRTIMRLGTACFNPLFVDLVNLFKRDDRIHLGASMPAGKLAKLAGSYAVKYAREALDKPWKSAGLQERGFALQPVNRVLRGDLPPSPGTGLFKWVYGVDYSGVEL